MSQQKLYNINSVSIQTGLSQDLIRAWERRYSVVSPVRTATNRRMYTDDDIRRFSLLKKATELGESIGNVSALSNQDIETIIIRIKSKAPFMPVSVDQPVSGVDSDFYINKSLKFITELNTLEFNTVLEEASISLGNKILITEVIAPLIQSLGKMWQEGSLRIIHEHLASSVIRSFLGNIIRAGARQSSSNIVVATPAGNLHELGALMISVLAQAHGWNVIYPGPNLPAEEIIYSAKEVKASMLALSLVYPASDYKVSEEIIKMGQYAPNSLKIIAGGRVSHSYAESISKINASIVTGFEPFFEELTQHHF